MSSFVDSSNERLDLEFWLAAKIRSSPVKQSAVHDVLKFCLIEHCAIKSAQNTARSQLVK